MYLLVLHFLEKLIHILFIMHSLRLIACMDIHSSMPNLQSSDVICYSSFLPFSSFIYRTTMSSWIKDLSRMMIVIGVCVFHLRTTSAIGNETISGYEERDDDDNEYLPEKDLMIAWIEKPPYTTSPTNESLDNELHGMLRDVLLLYVKRECGDYAREPISYNVKTFRADSEFHMIELLRQNKVHVAAPIFEPTERRYNEFPFFKITDYPGSEYITSGDEANKLNIVLDAVMESWSLLAVTLILTAIAGVIMWALVC